MLRKSLLLGAAVIAFAAASYTVAKDEKGKSPAKAASSATAATKVPPQVQEQLRASSVARPSGAAATATVKPTGGGSSTNQIQFGPPVDPAAAGAPIAPALTDETLAQMLTNMGLEYTTVEYEGGRKGYDISLSHGTWTIPTRVLLSPNGNYLWLVVTLTTIQDPATAPADKLLALMQFGESVGPAHFTYNSGTFYLNLANNNMDVTPKRLRDLLQQIAGAAVAGFDYWDTSRWGQPTETPPTM